MMSIKIMEKSKMHDSCFSLKNKFARLLWNWFYLLFFRFSPTPLFGYRRGVLRLFGAKVERGARIYPSVKIWYPKNLIIGEDSTLGPFLNLYNQGVVRVQDRVIISQGAHICASTHDYSNSKHPLILAPITINDDVWICADAFIGPGVTIQDGTVIGARAVLMKSTDKWGVYAGNPAVKVKERNRFDD